MQSCRFGGAAAGIPLHHVISPAPGRSVGRPLYTISYSSSASQFVRRVICLSGSTHRQFSTTTEQFGVEKRFRKTSSDRKGTSGSIYRRPRLQKQSQEPVGDDFIEEANGRTVIRGNGVTKKEPWMIQKAALQEKFEQGWDPRKKLSPDALDGIRALNAQQPEVYTTEVLAKEFEISPEAVRRILKSKWRPNEKEAEARRQRWEKRGETIWAAKSMVGYKVPKRWQESIKDRISDNGRDAAVQLVENPIAKAIISRASEEREKDRIEQAKFLEEQKKKKEARASQVTSVASNG